MTGDQPTYRDLWLRIREGLSRKGRKTDAVGGEPKLPAELQGALHSLYDNYRVSFERWHANTESQARGLTPPVFVVVCNNTNVSKMVFDYVAGWTKPVAEGVEVVVPGAFALFNNEENGAWSASPNTILVDSEQLESGEGMSDEYKRIVAVEIEEFKAEYRARFPGRSTEDLRDEDLLREVMNTVGKAGKLGERVRCVVSVSMLTEGWDANTVTHILGVRAFGTQLLCEQVVGRGLRRMSYAVNAEGYFNPEYAEVYGVPFSFIPCSGSNTNPNPGPIPTRVRALEERIACEITFPRLLGYRYDVPSERLSATFTVDSKLALSTADIPTRTENAPIVGERTIHTLDDLKRHRDNEVAFLLAKLTLEKHRCGQMPHLARRRRHRVVGAENGAGARGDAGVRYVKNQSLGFTIPYTLNGEEKQYYPDFIAQMSPSARRVGPSGPTEADLLNVIVEVTGEARKDKAAKVTTARTLWVPAVNNHGGFGRWAFVEVNRPVGRTAHDWGGSCAGSQAGRSGRVKRRKRASASTFGAFGGSHHVYGHSAIPELINLQDVGGRSTVPASGAVTVCRRGDGAILRSFRIRIVFGAFSSSATKSRALGSSSVAKDLWLKAFEMC